LHGSEGESDPSAVIFVGARLVPVEEPVIGLGRADTREYHGLRNACTSDLICIRSLSVRVLKLLCVISGCERASWVASGWRNDQCSTGSDKCNQESDGLHFDLEVGFKDAMSVLLLLKGQTIPWATMAMYTKSLNRLKLTLQCFRDICSIAQSESSYELLDMALQTHGVLLQQRHCGVGVLRRKCQLRRAVRLKLRRRNICTYRF
jgi:hypothetical protein